MINKRYYWKVLFIILLIFVLGSCVSDVSNREVDREVYLERRTVEGIIPVIFTFRRAISSGRSSSRVKVIRIISKNSVLVCYGNYNSNTNKNDDYSNCTSENIVLLEGINTTGLVDGVTIDTVLLRDDMTKFVYVYYDEDGSSVFAKNGTYSYNGADNMKKTVYRFSPLEKIRSLKNIKSEKLMVGYIERVKIERVKKIDIERFGYKNLVFIKKNKDVVYGQEVVYGLDLLKIEFGKLKKYTDEELKKIGKKYDTIANEEIGVEDDSAWDRKRERFHKFIRYLEGGIRDQYIY
jgi:hypothetical protein